ncbi:MAG: putative amino-acid metabolite efflux pump [Promethearchaeota archaeon]|jgi:drug/metabolite transporter (DMT)-like permease|nr:MAG: putative amino-acid metabolite efflux pump [Candidatus Lokiarchaeota archaeon]
METKGKIYLQLTLMILLWCLSFIMVDIGVDIIPPFSLALYRFIISSLVFFCIRLYTRMKSNSSKIEKERIVDPSISKLDWLYIIIASFSGITLFFFTQYSAIQIIGPSLPALFVCLLAPVIIAILALVVFNERINKLKLVGFTVATIGGFLLVTGGDIQTLNPNTPNFLGYFYALLTPLLWAVYSIISKKITKKISTIKFLEIISYFGTVELFLFVLFTGQFAILIINSLNPILILSGLYLGFGCHIIGYYIWTQSQHKIDSFKAASFLYIEPFITLIFSFLLQREETIVILNILGGIIVLIGVIVINYER